MLTVIGAILGLGVGIPLACWAEGYLGSPYRPDAYPGSIHVSLGLTAGFLGIALTIGGIVCVALS